MADHGWDEVKEKFNAALSMSVKERELYLKQLSTESTQLHHEVADLLAKHADADEIDFLKSLRIGKQTEADLADTIAAGLPTAETVGAGLPTIDMQQPDRTVSLAGLKTLDTKEVTIDLKLSRPNSLDTISTAAPIDESPYLGEIGDYLLIEQIGRGGMGVVYKAYQKNVGRTVALKVIAAGSLCAPEDIARFHDEASAAGRLNHPGIVQVYDAGEHNGTHYFSMAYVEGESLASYVGTTKPRLEPRKAAQLMESVCRAVQYAHDRAIIHRDIKPANIMLDKSGQPLLTDFGLAKLVGNEGLTMTGQVMGTPNYMAPEQAKGAHDQISNRTDVYSLGATLYALLAGVPAFVGKTLVETLRKVESAAPASLVFKGSPVPLDLWIICEKCLAKRPEDRYESAGALADDLQRYLHGFPITARAVGPWTRMARWCQRNPLIATLVGAIAATLVIATVVSTGLAIVARAEQARAKVAQQLAEKNLELLEDVLQKVLISVSDELSDQPGTQAVRMKLLSLAEEYYQDLSNTEQISPLKVAKAAYLLGRIQSSLSLEDKARNSFQKALSIQSERLDEVEDKADAIAEIAATHKELSRLGEKLWNPRGVYEPSQVAKEALLSTIEHESACADYRQQALDLDPSNQELQRLLANSKMGLGLALIQRGRWEPKSDAFVRAEKSLSEAQSIWDKLMAKSPDDPLLLKDIARGGAAEADLKEALAETFVESNPSRHEELLRESLALRTMAAKKLGALPKDAVNPEVRSLLANTYQLCAESSYQLGMTQESIIAYENTLAVWRQLLMNSPQVGTYRVGVAQTQFMLAQLMCSTKSDWGYVYGKEFQQTLADGLAIDPHNQGVADLLIDFTKSFAEGLVEQRLFQEALNHVEHAKTALDNVQVLETDQPLIDAVTKKVEIEAEKLRDKINTEDRTT